MLAVWQKELKTYYYTSAGYVFMGIFLTLSAVFFYSGNMAERSSNLMALLRSMSYLWMLLCPLLTMRLVAGERQLRTDVLLGSLPLPASSLIVGKYLAAATVLLLTTVCTWIFPAVTALYGKVYLPETLTGYLGFTLMGLMFIALDMTATCLCLTPLTACVAGLGINLAFWLFDVVAAASSGTVLARALTFLSPNQRFTPFTLGQLSLANIIYALCFICAMLLLCERLIKRRRR